MRLLENLGSGIDIYLGPRPPLTVGALDRIFRRNGLRVRLSWIDEAFQQYETFSSVEDAFLLWSGLNL